jgi:hypothetical protein
MSRELESVLETTMFVLLFAPYRLDTETGMRRH